MSLLQMSATMVTDIVRILPLDSGGLGDYIPDNPPAGSQKLIKALGILFGWLTVIGAGLALIYMVWNLAIGGIKKGNERKFYLSTALGSFGVAFVLSVISTVLNIATGFFTTVLQAF